MSAGGRSGSFSAGLLAGLTLGLVLRQPGTLPPPGEPEAQSAEAGLTEVGAAGGDLRYWRTREALRHAELRLGVQAQATQALESRATSMIGWNVTLGLALVAAVFNGTHARAAGAAAFCLLMAALLCIVAIATRKWIGPGYQPNDVLNNQSLNELLFIEAMVDRYQAAVNENSTSFNRFQAMLNGALIFMIAAPTSGAVMFALEAAARTSVRL